MAAAATRSRRSSTKAAKPEPVEEEPEELETEDELEELEEDEVAESKPSTKKTAAAQEVTFGIRDLVDHIKAETGKDTDPRAIRTLIRKMARDGSGRVQREITAGNRTRYDWSGPNDPEVVAIVSAFSGGELDQVKKEKLDALKEQKAKKVAAKKAAAAQAVDEDEADEDDETPAKPARRTAAKKAAPARRARAKKAPEPEVVEDDEELDLDDDE